MPEIREIGNFEEHIEIQKHIADFKELRQWVINYTTNMKEQRTAIPDILVSRIVELEAKQAKLWDLLTKESPQTKEPKLSPHGRRIRERLGGLR